VAPQSKVILLEFNELSPTLITGFMERGHLPNFQRLYKEAHVYVTNAEEAPPNLEPWIQWVTVHTGLSYRQHGVFDLGDGHKLESPRIWDIASAAGLPVWVCGSMNAGYKAPIRGALLPDPWSTGITPSPTDELMPYYHFVRTHVQEYSADKVPIAASDVLKFVAFMASHGLSAKTASGIVKQLMSERSGHGRWKRATILDRLQWDVFLWYYRKLRPAFATFFINSTAHFQHVYWRNMDPEPFSNKPTTAEQEEYNNAVLYGYQQMDELVGQCLQLADADTTVVLSSALGQQPCLIYEEIGGKTFYKPRDPEHLFGDLLGMKSFEYAPVMSEQFRLYMADEAAADAAAKKLTEMTVNGTPVFIARREGREVFAGCGLFATLPADATMRMPDGKSEPFFRYLYKVDITKSGMHHPDGILWIRTPDREHTVTDGKVSLRDVAPTLLNLIGLKPTEQMTGQPLAEVVGAAV
jgi:hypothetical protein